MSEGSLHYDVKHQIFSALAQQKEVAELEMEHPFALTTSRQRHLHQIKPDITFQVRGCRVAIEVQRSRQTWEEIAERTACYHELGIFVLWILLREENVLEGRQTSIPEWEQGVHALYYGMVYLWLKGATILPIHLQPCLNSTDRLQGGRWVSSFSKRMRFPWFLPPIQITNLQPEVRPDGEYGRYALPAAHLWNVPYMVRKKAREATHSFLDIRTSLYRIQRELE